MELLFCTIIYSQVIIYLFLKLLADKSVELEYIETISEMSIHRLKKHNLSLA
jgi:hypothetical protein